MGILPAVVGAVAEKSASSVLEGWTNAGRPGAAVLLPRKRCADTLLNVNASDGVVVAFATEVEKSGARLPALNEVTVPDPPPAAQVAQTTLPLTSVVRHWPEVPGTMREAGRLPLVHL